MRLLRLILAGTMRLFSGERARPRSRTARLAPNIRGMEDHQTADIFERSCEPRGRGSLRPGRARSPFHLYYSGLVVALLLAMRASAELNITNDTMVTTWSDSFSRGGAGQRQNFFLGTYFINYYPQYFISYRDHSRSGASNLEMLTSRVPMFGIPDAGASYGKTNGLNIFYVSGNGPPASDDSYDSNSIYGFFKELLQYPTNTYNRFGVLTNDWSQPDAQNLFHSVVIGDIPYNTPDGYPISRDYSYGGRGAAQEDGAPFVDSWSNLLSVVTNANANGPNLWFPPNFDHPANELQFLWAMTTLRSLAIDTNTYTAILDFNAAAVSSTNHCSVTDLSRVGNSLSFTFHADRMGPGFYVPDGTITNDCRGAFPLMPDIANQFCEILRITNLPVGNYEFDLDGSNVVTLTSAQLCAGYNGFTNYNGAFWAQKKEILGLLCDMLDVLRSDALTPAHPGNGELIPLYEAYGRTWWPTNTIGVDEYIAQMSSPPEMMLQAEDALIHAAAQQTNHVFTITLVSSPQFLSIERFGDESVISWTNAGYLLQSAPEINGPFTTIQDAVSPYTNIISEPMEFFRLMTNQ